MPGDTLHVSFWPSTAVSTYLKVQVGKDQEKAQSEKDSHSKNRHCLCHSFQYRPVRH